MEPYGNSGLENRLSTGASGDDAVSSLFAGIDAFLRCQESYPHPADNLEVRETALSIVYLAGDYAYKLKKPVNLGYVDYTTLERRLHFCLEEVRLNGRLAPDLYLGVVSLELAGEEFRFGHEVTAEPSPGVEYLVKMRRFGQEDMLDSLMARGLLTETHVIELVRQIVPFHAGAAQAGKDIPFASRELVCVPVRNNFEMIRKLDTNEDDLARMERIRLWSEKEYEKLAGHFDTRKSAGFVRECHGDLHLGNIALYKGRVTVFDGVEFNDMFRWIDVMSDLAFLLMDLEEHGRPDLSHMALAMYLEESGDYGALSALNYYKSYRAMVRAKVACIRRSQPTATPAERERLTESLRKYLSMAEGIAYENSPVLIAMTGVAGSGKTTVANGIIKKLGVVRTKSDVERKRLFGLPPDAKTRLAPDAGIYSPDAGIRTYNKLLETARSIVSAGYGVVLDATYLAKSARAEVIALGSKLDVPVVFVETVAEECTILARVEKRAAEGRDASEADAGIVKKQLASAERLSGRELEIAIRVDTSKNIDIDFIADEISRLSGGKARQ